MANLVETSNNDQPAVSGENTLTLDQLLQIAEAQNKSPFEIGSGAGIQGKGVVGVEATGSERGIVARGKTAIFCQGDDTSLSALAGNGVAIRGASLNGVGLEISGARVAARFTGNVEINGDLDASVIRSLLQRVNSLEGRVASLEGRANSLEQRVSKLEPLPRPPKGPVGRSDKTKKENFQPVDGERVLGKIRGFELSSWNFIGHNPKKFRHYGPMAQDFFAAFGNDGIGKIGTERTINSVDMAGILMIAVQALEKRTAELKQKEARIAVLESRLEALELRTNQSIQITAEKSVSMR